ncbi:MAG: porin family protein, partial [Candidatus Krumholzibacteriia bacterium]
MKKFTFALMLAAVALFVASPLFAEGMMFGVKGGLNMANITGDDAEGTLMKIGGLGGVFISYDITEIFAVQPEILFSMKGTKEDFEGTDVSTSLNYIEIPLLLKVNLPTEGAIKPSLYA